MHEEHPEVTPTLTTGGEVDLPPWKTYWDKYKAVWIAICIAAAIVEIFIVGRVQAGERRATPALTQDQMARAEEEARALEGARADGSKSTPTPAPTTAPQEWVQVTWENPSVTVRMEQGRSQKVWIPHKAHVRATPIPGTSRIGPAKRVGDPPDPAKGGCLIQVEQVGTEAVTQVTISVSPKKK